MRHPICQGCDQMLYKTLRKGEFALKGSDFVYCRNKDCERSEFFKKKKKIEKNKSKKVVEKKPKKVVKNGRAQKKRERVRELLKREKNPVIENTRKKLKKLLGDFDSPELLALVILLLADSLGEGEIVYFLSKKYNLEKFFHFKLS